MSVIHNLPNQLETPSYVSPAQLSNNTAESRETYLRKFPNQWSNAPDAAGFVAARHLVLDEIDERHRQENKIQAPGYCVDELCTCQGHKCIPAPRPLPFTHQSLYRDEYTAKELPEQYKQPTVVAKFDANGIPLNMSPSVFYDYIKKHGMPPNNEFPISLFNAQLSPETRDFSTVNRCSYTSYGLPSNPSGEMLGINDCPKGIDPTQWREYISKNGPVARANIPSSLYYKHEPDTRDFTTEFRAQYTQKGSVFSPLDDLKKNVPDHIDPVKWEEYVDKHRNNFNLSEALATLLPKRPSETRDFSTTYRANYVTHLIESCPLNRLPSYPTVRWPQKHVFWDPLAKQWY